MFPPFPQESARHYCQKLISLIDEGKVELRQISRESEERKGQGLMIGCLVCWEKTDGDFPGRRVVLYAVSGNSKLLEISADYTFSNLFKEKSIFVLSIVSVDEIDSALKQNDKKIHELTDEINELPLVSPQRKQLISERTSLTDASLKKVFSLYEFTRFDGQKISLNQIIQNHNNRLPPTGTGDCCAPKLLTYAFAHELEPVSMDEVYYGRDTANKKSGISYPPCDERCGYILPSILGLEVLYCDKDIIVINKPSGLLSVPGKGEDKQDCAEARVRRLFPQAPKQCAVHRLDMETSGILVLALNQESHRALNEQFAEGIVQKKYIALLDGILYGKGEGRTELPFRLDPDNRPHQIYDAVNGKLGITDWKKLRVEAFKNLHIDTVRKVTRIEFTPHTGRTHQLRLASSCPAEKGGLGLPIVGDTLYGHPQEGERLMLHAMEITFHHPTSGEMFHITCQPDF